MVLRRFRRDFRDLPAQKKYVFVGSFIAMISVFLPWYQETDERFGSEVFFGMNGPLYFLGWTIWFVNGVIFLFSYLEMRGKKLPRLPFSDWIPHMISGISSLYILVAANTIYFHSAFGVSLFTKETRFGMIVAFIGSIVLTLGSYLEKQSKDTSFHSLHAEHKEDEQKHGRIEPLICLSRTQRRVKDALSHEETLEDKEKEQQNLLMDL